MFIVTDCSLPIRRCSFWNGPTFEGVPPVPSRPLPPRCACFLVVYLQPANGVPESILVPLSSHEDDTASAFSVINGNRSSAPVTTGSLALANDAPSAIKPKAPSSASRGGRSADAWTSSSSAPNTALATSASKNDSFASATAAYATQQAAAAAAATGVAWLPAPSPAGEVMNHSKGLTAGHLPSTSEARNAVAGSAVPSAGQFVQVIYFWRGSWTIML